ncbi:hypothetical protein Herod_00130 [Acinetobacter phage Herod]|nr:hypothetical protein Herod_00130 [Acinetobacter phage Herod]
MSSHWYEAVINEFGTAENFIEEVCKKQGVADEDINHQVSQRQPKNTCLTVDELIAKLEEIREKQGGGALVCFQDSSGYDADCVGVTVDNDTVVIF